MYKVPNVMLYIIFTMHSPNRHNSNIYLFKMDTFNDTSKKAILSQALIVNGPLNL